MGGARRRCRRLGIGSADEAGRFAVPGAPGLVYAGAGPRLVAYIVDAVLIGIVGAIVAIPFAANTVADLSAAGAFDPTNPTPFTPLMTPVAGVGTILALLLQAAYFTLLWSSSGRATIGMRLLTLQVGDATTGNRIPVATAFRRWLAFGAWLNLFGIRPGARRLRVARGVRVGGDPPRHDLVPPAEDGPSRPVRDMAMVRPVNAGSGGVVIGCVLIAVAVVVLSFVALIFLGSQVSSILSAVGDSV